MSDKIAEGVDQRGGVPAGWKLVPIDPTPEMIEAGWSVNGVVGLTYRNMLAAAPKAPTTPDLAAKELVEAAQHSNDWLRGALDCKTWHWDGDQREMAESAHSDLSRALAALGGDNQAEGVG